MPEKVISVDAGTHQIRNACRVPVQKNRGIVMLYTIAIVLLIMWLLGLVTSYTMGGLIHILLVIALIVLVIRVLSGRSSL